MIRSKTFFDKMSFEEHLNQADAHIAAASKLAKSTLSQQCLRTAQLEKPMNDTNAVSFFDWDAMQKAVLTDICANRHKGNEHSVKANKLTDKVKDKQLILEALDRHPEGLTCEQLEDLCFLKHQTASARCSDLKREGRITTVGTSKTRSGSPCAVYKDNGR